METKRQLLDSILRTYYKRNQESIYHLLDRFEYISFDVFDTLIKRITVNPTDIFEIVERKYNQMVKMSEQITAFKEKRRMAQINAKKTDKEDVTLCEIYKELNGFSEEQKRELMRLEEETEINSVIFNFEIENIWQYCILEKKKIVCISDMYLSKEVIQRILQKCGITEYEKLYVSSEIQLKKSSGHLYEYVLNDLGIPASSILHIGDNWKSDFIAARRNKICAILWPRELNNIYYWEQREQQSLDQKMLYSVTNLNVVKLDNECERIGYEVLGILLLGFCKWIKKRSQGDQRLFFLARDAYIIQKAYELIYPEEKGRGSYLLLSRKSIIRPYLYGNIRIEDIWKLYAEKEHNVTYGAIWDDLGFTEKERNSKFDWNQSIRRKEFLEGDFKTIIEEKLKEEQELIRKDRDLLLKYFDQENVKNHVGFIDVGWKGTIPYCVEKIYDQCDLDIDLHNYMFGYINNQSRTLKHPVDSYIFEEQSMEDMSKKLQISLFEFFFLEPSGSTVGYREEDGKIVPNKTENENKDSIQNIISIQKGALAFIEDIKSYIDINQLEVDETTAIAPFLAFSQIPKLNDIKYFKNVQYFSMRSYGLMAKHERLWYFLHPNEFIKEFSDSQWKVGFLKDFFRIPLPYHSIYKTLKSIKNMKNRRIRL